VDPGLIKPSIKGLEMKTLPIWIGKRLCKRKGLAASSKESNNNNKKVTFFLFIFFFIFIFYFVVSSSGQWAPKKLTVKKLFDLKFMRETKKKKMIAIFLFFGMIC
jgi:hypothetical protein